MRVTRDQASADTRIDFDTPFHPAPRRSSLVVSAKAAFAGAGRGVTVLNLPQGAGNADELAEHCACVRQDSAGMWVPGARRAVVRQFGQSTCGVIRS